MEGKIDTDIAELKVLSSIPVRKSLGEHVFENLKEAIIRGEFPPGKRLVETSIADALHISRTPVREAIHKLEREGLLEKLPQGGFAVLGLAREDIEETFGIRSVLESYAARLATMKYKEEDLESLSLKIHEYENQLKQDNLDALPAINTEFHDLLYRISQSPRLVKMINDLRDQIFRFRQIILKNRELAVISHRDHTRMIEYMRKKDEHGVEGLVREHILRGRDAVLKEYDGNA